MAIALPHFFGMMIIAYVKAAGFDIVSFDIFECSSS